jgi:hypothetical protein
MACALSIGERASLASDMPLHPITSLDDLEKQREPLDGAICEVRIQSKKVSA